MSGLVHGRPGRRWFEPSYFCGDEPPVPPQDGVGCHDASDVREAAPAEHLAFHGQAASLVVGEAQPSGSVRRAEDPVLLEQVVNDRLLLPVDPAGEQQEKEGEWARQRVHGGSVPEGRSQFKGYASGDTMRRQIGSRCPGRQPPPIASTHRFSRIRPRPQIPHTTEGLD